LKVPNIKAEKADIKYDFIKIFAPIATEVRELEVIRETTKRTTSKYKPKTIKSSKLYKRVI